jgi:diguanylate cyclase (GGDEF)-like protein/PAS domain S-box-containing protein
MYATAQMRRLVQLRYLSGTQASSNAHVMSRTVLLVTANPADAGALQAMLADADARAFTFEQLHLCSDACARLRARSDTALAAIIVDPVLPDSEFMPTIATLLSLSGEVPILLLARIEDEASAQLAMREGIHDYLLRDSLNTRSLRKALFNMLERSARIGSLSVEGKHARLTLNSIGDAIICTDLAGRITYLNPIAEHMTGWTRAEAMGRELPEVMHIIDGESRAEGINPLTLAMRRNEAVALGANTLLVRRDGLESSIEDTAAPIYDGSGRCAGAVVVFRDVSAAREMSLRMSHLAQHDFLTELPNRLLLNDRLTQAIAAARRHSTSLAVLFVDVDHFKKVNDTFGHTIGDELLRAIARRLVAAVRTTDTVSRHGGDEFVVLLSEIAHAADAGISADKILANLAAPYHLGQQTLYSHVSIGIGLFPADGTDAETLIRSADRALLRAKEMGRNRRQFFDGGQCARGRREPADVPGQLSS